MLCGPVRLVVVESLDRTPGRCLDRGRPSEEVTVEGQRQERKGVIEAGIGFQSEPDIEEGIRVMGHELGPWSLFTIWDTNEYVYHATTKLGDGMMWEDAAGQIFQRWIQTMPQTGGTFGRGKSKYVH